MIPTEREKERRDTMTTKFPEKSAAKIPPLKRLVALVLLFALIFSVIFILRSCSAKESAFVDEVAGQIRQEMADNQIVLSSKGIRRTVARNPV